MELVTIGEKQVEKLEYMGQPVMTLKMVDEVHDRNSGTARYNFNSNKKHFGEGKHYFVGNSHEAKALGVLAPRGITLLTESGYLKLVRTFGDDKAWDVQDKLIDCYFHVKQEQQETRQAAAEPEPEPQPIKSNAAFILMLAQENMAQAIRLEAIEAQSAKIESKLVLIEAKQTNRNDQMFTVAGFAMLHGLKFNLTECSTYAKKAIKASETMGYTIDKVYDPRWGKVNVYHSEVLQSVIPV